MRWELLQWKKYLLPSNRDNDLFHPVSINTERKINKQANLCGCCCSLLTQQVCRWDGVDLVFPAWRVVVGSIPTKHTLLFNFSTLHNFKATYISSYVLTLIINLALHVRIRHIYILYVKSMWKMNWIKILSRW